MATMPLYAPGPDPSQPRSAPPSALDDFADLDTAFAIPSARRRRRTAVMVLGWTCIAGLSAAAVWMATSTAAHGAIASWATLGTVAQPRLTLTLEGTKTASPLPEAPRQAPVAVTTAQGAVTAPEGAASAAPDAAGALAAHAAKPRAWAPVPRQARHKDVGSLEEDPYAGATPRPQEPVAEPHPEAEKAREDPY
jgi:hypothetical protein